MKAQTTKNQINSKRRDVFVNLPESPRSKYQCISIEYGIPLDYCLYTIRDNATAEVFKLSIRTLFNQVQMLTGFSGLDIQRICLDYASATEINTQGLLKRYNIIREETLG